MIAAEPSVQEKLVTGEELLAMGDIGRAELIDGRIKYMPPTSGAHGYFEGGITTFLDLFVRRHKLGWVLPGEVGIYIRRAAKGLYRVLNCHQGHCFKSEERKAHATLRISLRIV